MITPRIDLSRAIRLHKQARGSAPSLDAVALIVEMLAHVERHRVPAADVEPLILAALLEGAALAKAATRLGCAPAGLPDVGVCLFARPIAHALVDDVMRVASPEKVQQTIHILQGGRAICGAGAPRDWPTGTDGRTSHRWLGIEDAQHSTCPGCLLRAADIIEARAGVPVIVEHDIPEEAGAPVQPLTPDTGESPEADGALGRALDLLAEDVAAEVIASARADLAAEAKPLRRPRCTGSYIPDGPLDEVTGEACGRPADHKGDCGPAKPPKRRAGA